MKGIVYYEKIFKKNRKSKNAERGNLAHQPQKDYKESDNRRNYDRFVFL